MRGYQSSPQDKALAQLQSSYDNNKSQIDKKYRGYNSELSLNQFDGVPQAFEYGIRSAPGDLAEMFEGLASLSPWSYFASPEAMSATSNYFDNLTGVNDLNYDPNNYKGLASLTNAAELTGNLVGDPLNAIPVGFAAKQIGGKLASAIGSDLMRPSMVNQVGAINPGDFGLPVNPDGTVSLLHGTTREGAESIINSNRMNSAGEPDVYFTNSPDAGYGDGSIISADIDPERLFLDDAFPDGRYDFRLSAKGQQADVANARLYQDNGESLGNKGLLGDKSSRMQRMEDNGLERGWYRGGKEPADAPWYSQDRDYAKSFAKGDFREYALPVDKQGMNTAIPNDILAKVADSAADNGDTSIAKEIRLAIDDGEPLSYSELNMWFDNNGSTGVNQHFRHAGVEMVSDGKTAYMVNANRVRDAKKATFDPDKKMMKGINLSLGGLLGVNYLNDKEPQNPDL